MFFDEKYINKNELIKQIANLKNYGFHPQGYTSACKDILEIIEQQTTTSILKVSQEIPNKFKDAEWRSCKTDNPKSYDDFYGYKLYVMYKCETDVANNPVTGITEARWNGLEWRTDDFGLSDKKNLFNSPNIKPIKWTAIMSGYQIRQE